MLRSLALLTLVALTSACGDKPRAIEVDPGSYDFGRVMQGNMPEFAFTLTNHSNRTVGFKAVPNCACFAAAQGMRPLDPGQSQQFRVLFDTTKLMGLVQGKWITIHTDHPDMPRIVVPLEGEIYRAFSVTPESFRLGVIDGRPANYEPRVIRVRPESGYTVRLERSVVNPGGVLAFKTVPQPSGGFDVEVSIPRDVRRPGGAFNPQVRLELALTAPGGQGMRQSVTVQFSGLWSLKP